MNENPHRDILLRLLCAERVIAETPEQWLAVVTLAQQHGVKGFVVPPIENTWNDRPASARNIADLAD